MSRFNKYARKVNDVATEAFADYRKAEKTLQAAEAKTKEYPQRGGFVDAEYAAKAARAQADYAEAKSAFKKATEAFKGRTRDIAALRKELVADLDDYYAADPAAIDSATIELLKSGILKGSEYAKLMQKAQDGGNYTMCRLIASYAGEAAADVSKRYGENSEQARELRAISYLGNQNNGSDTLAGFDLMADVFNRCTNNSALIDKWDELTGDVTETL